MNILLKNYLMQSNQKAEVAFKKESPSFSVNTQKIWTEELKSAVVILVKLTDFGTAMVHTSVCFS